MAKDPVTPAAATRPSPDVPLVHFTMRHLLLFVAGVSALCMILVSLEGYSVVVFGVGTILVAGHVLSTVIGSRLRAAADAARRWEEQQTPRTTATVLPSVYLPRRLCRSQLQIRTACSPVLWWFVAMAGVCGGLLGAGGIAFLAGWNVGWPALLIGALSGAMIVGWGALIVAGICGIARRSWRGGAGEDTRA